MIHQHAELNFLKLLKRAHIRVVLRKVGGFLAGVHKRKGVPSTRLSAGSDEGSDGWRGGSGLDLIENAREARVGADEVEPIFGVAVIGLAAVHDPMQARSVSTLDFLGEAVGGLEVVVPEEYRGAEESLGRLRDGCFLKKSRQEGFQPGNGEPGGADLRAERGGAGFGNQFFQGRVWDRHALKLHDAPFYEAGGG